MGKSPGKWIKSIFGKKSSKSSSAKASENLRSSNAEETLVSAKLPISDLTMVSSVISRPIPGICDRNGMCSIYRNGSHTKLADDGEALPSVKQEVDSHPVIVPVSTDDVEKLRHEQAVTKAQALCRGYLARRALRSLKGLIRLQAICRGHLLRRQAVATLWCVFGIVKLQALVRGHKGRCSGIVELPKTAFARKLLASSSTPVSFRLDYGKEEPNSVWEWLERWTKSHFWELHSNQNKFFDSKSEVKGKNVKQSETEQGRPEHETTQPLSELEKVKCSLKTLNSQVKGSNVNLSITEQGKPRQETIQPSSELEKIKSNLRVLNYTTGASDRLEPDTTVIEQGKFHSAETIKENVGIAEPNHSEVEEHSKLLHDEKQDTKKRRASLPAKHDHQESGLLYSTPKGPSYMATTESAKAKLRMQGLLKFGDDESGLLYNTPKRPSYMAATESAKAKLRMQGLPKFGDGVDKNGYNRRHSLPSLVNGKLVPLSPRVQNMTQASGKVGIRLDKSLSSSRDSSDKMIQPGWRR